MGQWNNAVTSIKLRSPTFIVITMDIKSESKPAERTSSRPATRASTRLLHSEPKKNHHDHDEGETSNIATVASNNDDDDKGRDSSNDEHDIEIERENSAWDALGERFQDAASNGRYLDLTNDYDVEEPTHHTQQQLSANQARQDFQAVAAPVYPSTTVQYAQSQDRNTNSCPNPQLQELWDLITGTIDALKETREKLSNPDFSSKLEAENSIRSSINGINRSVSDMGRYVKRHGDLVLSYSVAVRRIEELNLLVHKANIFINQFNKQWLEKIGWNHASLSSPRRGRKRRR